MSLDTRLTLDLASTLTGTADLASVTSALAYPYRLKLPNGTAAGQASKVWADHRSIPASSNDDIDLAGVLTDALGAALTFARVKALVVRAADTNVNNVVVGGASSTFATWNTGTNAAVVVRPSGLLVLAAPDATAYAVTATSADLLRLTNSGAGTAVEYDIVVIGA